MYLKMNRMARKKEHTGGEKAWRLIFENNFLPFRFRIVTRAFLDIFLTVYLLRIMNNIYKQQKHLPSKNLYYKITKK